MSIIRRKSPFLIPRNLELMPCSNVERLGHSVQVAIEEIYRCTTHKSFVMCGGPSAGARDIDSITYVYIAEVSL